MTHLETPPAVPFNTLRLTGRERDQTGLTYYGHVGMTHLKGGSLVGPIGFDSGEPNFYAYVDNDPSALMIRWDYNVGVAADRAILLMESVCGVPMIRALRIQR